MNIHEIAEAPTETRSAPGRVVRVDIDQKGEIPPSVLVRTDRKIPPNFGVWTGAQLAGEDLLRVCPDAELQQNLGPGDEVFVRLTRFQDGREGVELVKSDRIRPKYAA